MNLPESIRSLQWRPIAGLMLAGVLGWLAAWFMLPGPTGASAVPQPPVQSKALAGQTSTAAIENLASGRALEQLSRSQSMVSEGAARSVPAAPAAPGVRSAAPASGAMRPAAPDAAARAARTKAMLELQASALAEIRSVPPGDTVKLMAAMERFDSKMRAAGAPSIIDMDKMRKTMEGLTKIQELNRQLVAETEKGRNADPNKIQALAKDVVAAQKSMPQQFIKTDVLQQQLTR
jgi:hypothetical protein